MTYYQNVVREIVKNALHEDLGNGDLTSEATIPEDLEACGKIIAREDMVVAGLEVAKATFEEVLGNNLIFESFTNNGCAVRADTCIGYVKGSARGLLAAERVALNFLMRLCGIATLTRQYVEAVKGTKAKIVDTRKTTPGLRTLEKAAVVAGGGNNHRFGLYDGVLIKDNHISLVGGVGQAISMARSKAPHTLQIEVEVENMDQLHEALRAGADVILLDNMSPAQVKEATQLIKSFDNRIIVEVSGGINLSNVRDYAEAGVDIISVGALTHSARAMDISLDITPVTNQ